MRINLCQDYSTEGEILLIYLIKLSKQHFFVKRVDPDFVHFFMFGLAKTCGSFACCSVFMLECELICARTTTGGGILLIYLIEPSKQHFC
jgi:hypothetical protein